MKPIIQNKNKLNIKNFISNLKYLNYKKENDNGLYQSANLKVLKYFDNLFNQKKTKNKRKNNSISNNNSSKYASSLKDLKEIIKRISKTVNKEKAKLKLKSDNYYIKLIKKGKSADIIKNHNKNKSKNKYKKEEKKENKKYKLEKELEKENRIKKIYNIKQIDIKQIDYIIENKKMGHNINDNSNISLPPLLYSRQLLKYNKPLLIGLNNLGFTCYLNAILQCLNQTEPLTNYFLSEEGISKVKNNNLLINDSFSLQLSPSYLEVIKNLWDIKKNNKSYSPIHFYEKLNEMNNIFKLNKPNDSKDLLKFIFKQFHKELNIKKVIINNYNKNDSNFEQYDRIKTFNKFLIDFTGNNCSIISNYFFGINEVHKECIKCKNFFINQRIMLNPVIYEFKIYNMLIFPLDEVKKLIIKNNKKENNNKITIYDCFYYYQNKRTFIKEKKNFCKRCNQLISYFPLLLIIFV